MAERVLIVGGGDGGTILANALRHRSFDVTVLSASMTHLFQRGLLYVAFRGATPHLARDEQTLLGRHVRLVNDRATHIDLVDRSVTTAGGRLLEYDQLVVATGIGTDPSQIPGLAELDEQYGNYHSSVRQAQKLWKRLDAFRGGTIVLGQSSPICKCPPSPIEGILLTDELLQKRGLRDKARLVFFTPYPRPYPAEAMNEVIEPILKDRNIEVLTFFDVDRIDVESSTIYSIEGDEIRYDLPIVIPPFVGADISYDPAGVLDESRFVVTNQRNLRIEGVDRAFAIGDANNLPTSKAGVGAHLEAKVVARTLAGKPATFNGRTNCSLDVGGRRSTYIVGSYDAPVVKLPPSRFKYLTELGFSKIFWWSLRGWVEPAVEAYFKLTEPTAAKASSGPSAPPG
jgi:sulfide:quinone oxidoreductase